MNTPACRSYWAVHIIHVNTGGRARISNAWSAAAVLGLWACPSRAHQAAAALEISQQIGGKPRGSCTNLLWSVLTRQNVSPCLHFSLACNSGAIVSHFAVCYTRLTSNALFKESSFPEAFCNTVNKHPQGQFFFPFPFPLLLFYSSLIRSTADSAIYKSVPPKGIRFIFCEMNVWLLLCMAGMVGIQVGKLYFTLRALG